MRPIVLSGFMATGKSTVGQIVARRLALPFLDTDQELSARTGATVGELFAREGEARFREREAELVMPMLEDPTPRVLSFGGGTVTMPRVRYAALEACTVVTLTASAETIVARVPSLAERPNLGQSSPLTRTRDLLALRREAYAECHREISTEGRTPEQIADLVIEAAREDTLAVPLGTRSYCVELANGQPDRLTATLKNLAPTSLVLVSDENVYAARRAWIDEALAPLAHLRRTIVLPPGEPNKTLASVTRIWDEALAGRGVDRRAVVLAFGGGVVGDLAGFASSTLLRGLRCVQVPTSLLAMVDASVGGKTAFDVPAGKNLVGAFFQPSRVLVDLDQLSTLPARERTAGLAEVVKIALVCDAELLAALEREADRLVGGDHAALRSIVQRAILAKIRVVRDDEKESGVRALLNLGHTVGHALEAHGGYATLLHGEAVAIGSVLEIRACERLGLSPAGTAARAEALFARLGLPTDAPRSQVEAAWPFVFADKKRDASNVLLPIVVADGAGEVRPVRIDALRDAVRA